MVGQKWWLSSALMVAMVALPAIAMADEAAGPTGEAAEVFDDEPVDEDRGGFRHQSALQIRARPVGLSLFSDTAHRTYLFDSESVLFADAYVDGGITTAFSPAFAWVGPYVEMVPIAVLNLRVSVQHLSYFGTFGFLHDAGTERDWSLDALDRSADQSLGMSATGFRLEARATPQMRVDRIVFTAETSFHIQEVDVDRAYYEPYFDILFEPQERFLITRPTLGYLIGSDLSHWYLLVGARWERIMTANSDITRDTAGLVWAWSIPDTLIGFTDATFAGFAGVHIDHPNRGDSVDPYMGVQFVTSF